MFWRLWWFWPAGCGAAFWLASSLPAFAVADLITVQLQPRTVEAFDAYMRSVDERFQRQLKEGPFLWAERSPQRRRQLLAGKVVAEPMVGRGDIQVPDGLVHDWIAAAFVPRATLAGTLHVVQDYDHHAAFYKPDVLAERLLAHEDDTFRVYIRVLKKQIVTVVLDTEHEVRYVRVDAHRAYSRSHTIRIAEVEKPGDPKEHQLPPGNDHGFLWRLSTYWRFEEAEGGAFIECEAVSLTRDVPSGLGWIVNPIIRSLPRESLTNTLSHTKAAIER